MHRALLLVLLSFTLAACTPTVQHGPLLQKPAPGDAHVFAGAMVFDSRAAAFVGPKDVYTAGPRIVAVLDAGAPAPAAGAQAVRHDVSGRYLLPGLVDAHVHVIGSGAAPWDQVDVPAEDNLESYLRAGITTVFDLGGMGNELEHLAEQTESGAILGPRIYHAHLHITAPGGHPIPLVSELSPFPINMLVPYAVPQVAAAEDIPGVLDDAIAAQADYIKVVYDRMPTDAPRLSLELLTELVAQAHQRGKKVVAHIGSAQNAVEAAEAGVDLLAHGVYRTPVSQAQARRIAKTGTPMIFTTVVWDTVAAHGNRTWRPSTLDRLFVAEEQYRNLSEIPDDAPETLQVLTLETARNQRLWVPNIKTLHAAGVPLWVGTDSSLPGNYPGASLLRELELLTNAGIPPAQVLQAATLRPAEWIDADPMFGVIEPGASADLIVTAANPLDDLETLHRPRHILARGRLTAPVIAGGEKPPVDADAPPKTPAAPAPPAEQKSAPAE